MRGRPEAVSGRARRGARCRAGGPAAVLLLLLLGAAVAVGCGGRGLNYVDPGLPFYGEDAAAVAGTTTAAAAAGAETLRVVTFNIKFGEHVELAIDQLRRGRLRGADVVLLQEMDSEGMRTIADSLGGDWVYYPAVIHPRTGRQFGNGIVSRFPILSHRKLILPHRDANGLQRVAVLAELDVGGRRLRVVCLHLGTWILPGERVDQVRAVVDSLLGGEAPAVVGGDFNTMLDQDLRRIRDVLRRDDFEEATGTVRWSYRVGLLGITFLRPALDHIFVRGLEVLGAGRAARDLHASDHWPLWSLVVLPAAAGAPAVGAAPSPGAEDATWASCWPSRPPSPGPSPSSSSGARASRSLPTR